MPAVVTTDRKLLILGGRDGSVAAWDTQSLEPVRTFKGLTNSVSGLGASFEKTVAPARKARALALVLARHRCLWAAVWLAALAFVAQSARAAVTEAWVH